MVLDVGRQKYTLPAFVLVVLFTASGNAAAAETEIATMGTSVNGIGHEPSSTAAVLSNNAPYVFVHARLVTSFKK